MTEDLEKEMTKLEKYLIKEGRKDFVIEMRQSDSPKRESKLLGLAKHKQELITLMSKDVALKTAKEIVKGLKAPYNEQKRMNDKLSRFVHLLSEEEGLS